MRPARPLLTALFTAMLATAMLVLAGCSPSSLFGRGAPDKGDSVTLSEVIDTAENKVRAAVTSPTPVTVSITYCARCGHQERANDLAAELSALAPHAQIKFNPDNKDKLGAFMVVFNDIEVWFKYNAFPKASELVKKLP